MVFVNHILQKTMVIADGEPTSCHATNKCANHRAPRPFKTDLREGATQRPACIQALTYGLATNSERGMIGWTTVVPTTSTCSGRCLRSGVVGSRNSDPWSRLSRGTGLVFGPWLSGPLGTSLASDVPWPVSTAQPTEGPASRRCRFFYYRFGVFSALSELMGNTLATIKYVQ